MVFTRKNLQAKKRSMGFMKGATLFFLGMSAVMFMVRAFDVGVIAPNAVQYIQSIFLTSDGSNNGITGIILDGNTNGGITINNLTGKVVLGTDANGKLVGSSATGVYNFIAGLLVGGQTGANGVTGTSIVSGYVLNGILYLQYSGANGTGTWTVGSVQGNTGVTGATGGFTSFNCSTGEIIKYNGVTRGCSGDLQGGGGGTTYYTNTITGINFNSGNNVFSLYVSGSNAVTGIITLSGVGNWNSGYAAYVWMISSGTSLWNRYATTGINITSIATLHCLSGEIAKATNTGWSCAQDLQGVGGSSLWTMVNGNIYNNNRSTGNVGIGLTLPTYKLTLSGNMLFDKTTSRNIKMQDTSSGVADFSILGSNSSGLGGADVGIRGGNVYVTAGSGASATGGGDGGNIYLNGGIGGLGNSVSQDGVYGNVIIANTSGKVGIATNNPLAMLTVEGGIKPKTFIVIIKGNPAWPDPCYSDPTNYPVGTIFYNETMDKLCYCAHPGLSPGIPTAKTTEGTDCFIP